MMTKVKKWKSGKTAKCVVFSSFLLFHFSTRRADRGFIGLLTVIIIGALILTIGISTAFLGQTQLMLAGNVDHEYAVRSLVSACIEESLGRLKLDPAYVGGSVPLGSDACSVTVTGAGSTRTVTATGTIDGYAKAVTATATLKQNTALNAQGWSITAWQEADPP